jgi:hypothetical protein
VHPLVLVALGVGGLWALSAAARPRAETPKPYKADETADEIWNKFLQQHGGAPKGTTWGDEPKAPPSYAAARASLPPALQAEFDEAMASKDGAKAEALLNKLDPGYHGKVSMVLIRKMATS